MAESTVRVTGLRELNAAFRNLDGKLSKEFGDELKRAVEPVVGLARQKVERYAGSRPGKIRARRTGVSVYVEQSQAKVTGKRPDFGALQMRTVLIPALDETQDGIIDTIDGVLGEWARTF